MSHLSVFCHKGYQYLTKEFNMVSIKALSKAVIKATEQSRSVPKVVSICGCNYIWRDFVSPEAGRAITSIALLKVS
jgi:hypothetical protein